MSEYPLDTNSWNPVYINSKKIIICILSFCPAILSFSEIEIERACRKIVKAEEDFQKSEGCKVESSWRKLPLL